MKIKPAVHLFIAFLIFAGCGKTDGEIDCETDSSTYNNHVKDIIASSCNITGCHVAGFVAGDFTTYDGILSKLNNGTLITRIEAKTMPPATKSALSDADYKTILCWAKNGGVK